MSDDVDEQEQPRITAERPETLPQRIAEGPVLTPLGQYDSVKWGGKNLSGGRPENDYILILPDQPRERTTGGVYLSEQEIERMAYAAETGTMIALGPGAFAWNSDRTRSYQGEKPKPGTRVNFERYAGQMHHGMDGLIYRIITDKQIGLVHEPLPEGYEQYFNERGQSRVREIEATPEGVMKFRPHEVRVGGGIGAQAPPGGDPLSGPPTGWPRYIKRNGAILMAFNEDDARMKVPGGIWWATSQEAEAAASVGVG